MIDLGFLIGILNLDADFQLDGKTLPGSGWASHGGGDWAIPGARAIRY